MNKKILVVDDEEIIRENLHRILTEETYDVSTVASGREGLDYIANNDIDIVLLDLNLPDLNGIEVLQQAKELEPDLLVIIITGYASVDHIKQAFKQNAFEFFKKPVENPDVLVDAVAAAHIKYDRLKDKTGVRRQKIGRAHV